ncbi:GTP-binding protein [Myxococcota bacterium]|nr:GTP-binding protein [Myxococcota bacterium]
MGIFEREGPPAPVTILGGFLGAGKTTLLNHLIDTSGLRLGVIVNDFGAIDIDGRLVTERADGVVSLANGCVCCTIKGDVGRALFRLLEAPERPEHVLLETSGISNPGAVVETFVELARSGLVRIDGVVSVVDALHFAELDLRRGGLAWCQVVAADLVVVSKVDVATTEQRDATKAALAKIAPDVRVVEAARGELPASVVLGTRAEPRGAQPSLQSGAQLPGGFALARPHGFTSFTVTTTAPYAFKRLREVLRALPPSIYRAKGLLAIEERPGDELELHVVGRRLDVRTRGARPAGDTRSDLVLIGTATPEEQAALRAAIEACARPG